MQQPPPPNYGDTSGYGAYPQGQYPPPGGYPPPVGYPQQGGYPQDQGYPPQQGGYGPPPVPMVPKYGAGYGGPVDGNHGQPIVAGNADTVSDENEWAGKSFTDKAIRRAFVRKVYLILMCQLAFTAGIIAFFKFHLPTKKWIQGDGHWAYWVSYAIFLVTYITLVCCPGVRRKWPVNFICLAIFTAAFSYMAGMISSFYDTDIILIAAGVTALVCLSVTIFAMQTKWDFTMCGGLLFVLLMVLMMFGFACMITFFVGGPSKILYCVYGGLGALVFSLFLVYDTQMLMGGRKHELSPEEHIFGALQLYLDVVYIFLFLLSLFGNSSS